MILLSSLIQHYMRRFYQTRSSTQTLASQSQPQPPNPSPPAPPTEPVNPIMIEDSHITPPHLTGVLDLDPEPVAEQEPAQEFVPAPLPNFALPQDLQDAMTQLVQLMTIHFQGQQQAQAQPAAPAPQQRLHVRTRDPEPYDGTDPSKLCAFLSQCWLAFRSCPNNFSNDQIKITYAVLWLKGTALWWYEPNLSFPDHNLPNYAHW